MEFKAEVDKDGKVDVKAVVEKKGNDVIIHVPSFKVIEEFKRLHDAGESYIKKEVFINEEKDG